MSNAGKINEVLDLQEEKYITIISNRKRIAIEIKTILYVFIKGKNANIHVSGGNIYRTRMTLGELEDKLGDGFIKINRGCLVSAMAVHDITKKINLRNGEELSYTIRKKKLYVDQIHSMQKNIINSFNSDDVPKTEEEYRKHYSNFDNMPFAFTDIEMIFDEKSQAVDWIFRYGNPALAKLEKISLEQLIGNSFGSLFSNMDSKWLRCYERATLYGEILETIDYSPEIDKYLKVICFPTFKGHCGCILFDISEIEFIKNSSDSEKALMFYLGNLPENND